MRVGRTVGSPYIGKRDIWLPPETEGTKHVGKRTLVATILATILAAALAVGIGGCAMLKKVVVRPNVAFDALALRSADFQRAAVDVHFNVDNPNAFTIPLKGYDYTFRIGEHTVVSGTEASAVRIPARGSERLTLPVVLDYSDVTTAVNRLTNDDVWPYTVEGTVRVDVGPLGAINVPFSHSGEVARPVPPNISIERINVRSMSFRNIDLDVVLLVENSGSLDYLVNSLNGSIALNGSRFASIDGLVDALELKQGAQRVTVPLRVSAASMAQGLLNMLSDGEVRYELTGDATVRNSTFGDLPLNVESGGRVPLARE